ncbi:MAG: ThiF family adenylyltransferase [Candidatus Poseidoniaceae archaeon]
MNSPASAQNTPQKVLLIGAGGIGSHLTDLLCRGLHGHGLDLTLMDGDVVEERNLAHQRFHPNDIGRAKADVLAETYAKTDHNVTSYAEDLREASQLEGFDLIVVAVDRPLPRRLVHATNVPWIDLRSTGRGMLVLTHLDAPGRIASQTPDHAPASCQAEGVLEAGFVQVGFALAAAVGAQWVIDQVVHGRSPAKAMMMDAAYGGLSFGPLPEVKA